MSMNKKMNMAVLFSLLLISLVPTLNMTVDVFAYETGEFKPLLAARPSSISNPGQPPYTPQEIWKAYSFETLINNGWDGSGVTIAIVDAYGSPTIEQDLETFNNQFGLPSCTLNIYYPTRKTKKYDQGWAIETSLDVQWAHAIAPEATIALVVSKDASLRNIYKCLDYAIKDIPGVSVISMSFGLEEQYWPKKGKYTLDKYHALFQTGINKGISLFAASGDEGAAVPDDILYPASDPLVTAVGGTSLYLNSDGSYNYETTWSGSGAGYSIKFTEPSYQAGFGLNNMRDIADVAYNADPDTGVYVKCGIYWWQVGGTSAGAPQWSGLLSIAVEYHGYNFGLVNINLYGIDKAVYHDITTGNNGYFYAGTGWDYPTGWGTPDAYMVVTNLP